LRKSRFFAFWRQTDRQTDKQMDIIDAWSRNLAMASCDLKSKRESSIRLIVFHTGLRIGLQQALCCCIEFNSISIWRGVYSDTTQLNSTSSLFELCRYKHPFMRLALYNIVTSLVGWSLVGHVRELWLNGASEASYCWTPVRNRTLEFSISVVSFSTPSMTPKVGSGPHYCNSSDWGYITVLLRHLFLRTQAETFIFLLFTFMHVYFLMQFSPVCRPWQASPSAGGSPEPLRYASEYFSNV